MALLITPSLAQADGPPNFKPTASASCREFPNFTPEQCRYLRRKNAELSQKRTRILTVVEKRRYREDDRYRRDDERRPDQLCWPRPIVAKGTQRPGQGWAAKTARESWQRETRYDAGETYLSWSRAKKSRGDYAPGITCNESGISTLGVQLYRCEAKAIPCQAPRN